MIADPSVFILRQEIVELRRQAARAMARAEAATWNAASLEHDLNRTRLAIKRMRAVRRARLDAWWAAFMIGMLAGTTLFLVVR